MKNKEFEKLICKNTVEPSTSLKDEIIKSSKDVEVEPVYIQTKRTPVLKRFALVACSLVILVAGTLSGVGLYGENFMQVQVEVNPSISMTVNRFGVVNGVEYDNDSAKTCFEDLDLKGESVKTAVKLLTNRLNEQGYLTQDGQMFINCSSDKKDVSEELKQLHQIAKGEVVNLGYSTQVLKGIHKADLEQMAGQAYELGVYLTKYILIEMICANTDYTKTQLKDYTLTGLLAIISQENLTDKLEEISTNWDLNLYIKSII